MKKEKMITRTIETTAVNFKVFSVETANIIPLTVAMNGKQTVETAEKILREEYAKENSLTKFIMVDSVETSEELYGMPESVFMTYASKLPPRKNYSAQEDI